MNSPLQILFRQACDLTGKNTVWFFLRRMSAKHNHTVRKAVDAMLAARSIKPATSLWGFLVVITQKKDYSTRFFVDYRALNKRMKAEKFILPKTEEVVDDKDGLKVFSKLDMFASY